MSKRINMVGQVIGKWTVLEYSGNKNWSCKCQCGTVRDVPGKRLRQGNSKSCGCNQGHHGGVRESHGMYGTPEYRAWADMKSRCLRTKDYAYHRYGGRGITIHPEWIRSFSSFYDYMGPQPAGTHLDRIDSNGNYEPGNVRWLENEKLGSNRRTTILNETLVRVMRILHQQLKLAPKKISSFFPEVSYKTVNQVLYGDTWRWVQ